jgi:hypothetical protein
MELHGKTMGFSHHLYIYIIYIYLYLIFIYHRKVKNLKMVGKHHRTSILETGNTFGHLFGGYCGWGNDDFTRASKGVHAP